jgi:pimeloyl-ACP methyl ester carboxylesterase
VQVRANGIAIEVERRGDSAGTPVLMIMGLAMQLIAWPDPLVDDLVACGLSPVLFDNRDCGLSQDFESAGTPNIVLAAMRHALHLPVESPYALADMAADAAGVLDALGIASAHVVGVSMGGMIAQEMAVRHAERVRSLTLIMTTSGARHLPGPTWRARNAMMSRPAGRDTEARVAHGVGILRIIGSPDYPAEAGALEARVRRAVERAWRPRGVTRQLGAVIASGDRTALLSRIRQPTLVLHGREDPLVPAACGEELARRIPGAALEVVKGMGHDLPATLMPWLAARIADHCVAAR